MYRHHIIMAQPRTKCILNSTKKKMFSESTTEFLGNDGEKVLMFQQNDAVTSSYLQYRRSFNCFLHCEWLLVGIVQNSFNVDHM